MYDGFGKTGFLPDECSERVKKKEVENIVKTVE